MAYDNKEFECDIKENIKVLGENGRYTQEFTIIAWNNYPSKYDIRRWKEDNFGNKRATKGISLTVPELQNLKEALNEIPDLEKHLNEVNQRR